MRLTPGSMMDLYQLASKHGANWNERVPDGARKMLEPVVIRLMDLDDNGRVVFRNPAPAWTHREASFYEHTWKPTKLTGLLHRLPTPYDLQPYTGPVGAGISDALAFTLPRPRVDNVDVTARYYEVQP